MYAKFNIDKVILGIEELGTPEWIGYPDPPGIVVLPGLLDASLCSSLMDELRHEPFSPRGDYGNVRQEFDTLQLRQPSPKYPLIRTIAGDLQFAASLNRRTRKWQPNDIAVQRYLPGHIGISPHRDFLRDIYLIAIISLSGRAALSQYASKDDPEASQTWIIYPGDLVLLRAPGYRTEDYYDNPIDSGDDRPIHSISGPLTNEPRISLAYRMNTDYIND